MNEQLRQYFRTFSESESVTELPDSIISQMQQAHTRKECRHGEVIVREGEPFDGIFYIEKGSVIFVKSFSDGERGILGLKWAGAWFGEMNAFNEGFYMHDAVANAETVVVKYPAPLIRTLMHEYNFLKWLSKLTAIHLQFAYEAIYRIKQFNTEELMAWYVLIIVTSSSETNISTNQDIIGDIVGVSRQRIHAILKAWEMRGIIERKYGQIYIKDASPLIDFIKDKI